MYGASVTASTKNLYRGYHLEYSPSCKLITEQPEVPKHNCSEIILEGSSINCTCYASKMRNPPAHIAWSESGNEYLTVQNVGRRRSGTLAVCHLSWKGISKETVHTVTVMHGPSGIHISTYTRTSVNSTEIVLVCTAIDVYPSAVFLWNISCENTTDDMNTSTCTFSTASEEAEMIVECTASNRVFKNVSVSEIYVVHIPGDQYSILHFEVDRLKHKEPNSNYSQIDL